jgi:hypothetical protein
MAMGQHCHVQHQGRCGVIRAQLSYMKGEGTGSTCTTQMKHCGMLSWAGLLVCLLNSLQHSPLSSNTCCRRHVAA